MSELTELSRKRLEGVHPDLKKVVEDAAANAPFEILVVEGLRTVARQKKMVAEGKSRTMNSRHLTGHAIDLCAIVDGKMKWTKPHNHAIADLMKAEATSKGVDLEWGGEIWPTFKDTPHYQLSWDVYPKQDTTWDTKPKAVEVKAALKKSRKHRAAGWAKWGAGISGGVTAGWPAIKQQITVGQDIVATATQVLAANSLTVVAGLLIVGAITANWFQMMQKDDLEEGRYMPSGAAE